MWTGGREDKAAQKMGPSERKVDLEPFAMNKVGVRGCIEMATRMVKRSLILEILSR